jgi:hypothetical protein
MLVQLKILKTIKKIKLFVELDRGPFIHVSKPIFSLPTQRLQLGPTRQIRCQFALNLRSVRIANN